ncbi:MAG: polysaccharide biosynthesis tyrosine autokinase [Verrucomicrobia bacterium]|nr:polysaccharide biosynthesis tyrosine autokinase [Verrucomicrobiota bacterium]
MSKNGSNHSAPDRQPMPASAEIIDVTKPFDFRGLFHLLLEKWLLILLVSLTAAGGVFYYASRTPLKYQAKAVLQVEQEERKLIGTDSVSRHDLRSPEAINTIVQNVKNSSVLRRVIETNELASNPGFILQKDGPVSEAKLVRALAGMISVKLRPETRLIDITVQHRDSEMTIMLANSVSQEFIRQNLYDQFSTSKAANGLLHEEAMKLKAKLEESEQEIQTYREATQTISIEDREHITLGKIRDLTSRYTDAQSARLGIQAEVDQLNSISTNPAAILALPSVQADMAVSELRKRLVEQETRVALLAVEYQPTFPKLRQARQQLVELEKVVYSFAEKVRSSVQASYDAALAREKNLEQALRQTQAEAMELDKKSVGYNVLLRELQSDRALYDSVLKRLKETDLSKGLGQASLTMVEPASQPATPIARSRLILAGGSFMLSFIGMVALLYLLRSVRGSIQTVDEAEDILRLPVWAAIPATAKGKNKKFPHITAESPASLCSEGFRTLRTTSSIVDIKNEKRTMLFTSAAPAEGKTFCSLNYAICQAQEGKRTLLIDLDLRKPSVGANFDLPPETPGVTDYFVSDTRLNRLVQPTNYPNLFVLCSGPRIPNPAEALANGSVQDMLAEAGSHFDRIIVDTAPINAVSDTFLILPFVDQVCLVVKSGGTPQRAIKRAVDLMVRANVEPSGIVLNYLPERSGNYYYYAPKDAYGNGTYGEAPESRVLLKS